MTQLDAGLEKELKALESLNVQKEDMGKMHDKICDIIQKNKQLLSGSQKENNNIQERLKNLKKELEEHNKTFESHSKLFSTKVKMFINSHRSRKLSVFKQTKILY